MSLTNDEKENLKAYSIHLAVIEGMTFAQKIALNECPYRPELLTFKPEGGKHKCPVCGVEVLAGIGHPKPQEAPFTEDELTKIAENAGDVPDIDFDL